MNAGRIELTNRFDFIVKSSIGMVRELKKNQTSSIDGIYFRPGDGEQRLEAAAVGIFQRYAGYQQYAIYQSDWKACRSDEIHFNKLNMIFLLEAHPRVKDCCKKMATTSK